MKYASFVARNLMGLVFTVFGLNGFLHFIPQPPIHEPLAGQYMSAMAQSHYLVPVFLIQLVSGILLLSNYFVPLALTLVAPVIANILLFHGLMNPEGIAPGLVVAALWVVVFVSYRQAFAGLFQAKPVALSRDSGSAL